VFWCLVVLFGVDLCGYGQLNLHVLLVDAFWCAGNLGSFDVDAFSLLLRLLSSPLLDLVGLHDLTTLVSTAKSRSTFVVVHSVAADGIPLASSCAALSRCGLLVYFFLPVDLR
jgi:hypothetical protein